MKRLNLQQGTPEWLDARAKYFTASEAPAMMGASKYQSRADLLAKKTTGVRQPRDISRQRLFDRGHEAESAALPWVEDYVSAELFPATVAKGNLLASLDGLSMDGRIVFEHKLWNEKAAQQLIADGEVREPHYYWQLEQQLLVTGAKKALFVMSDGTKDQSVCVWYKPVKGRAERLIGGWAQFKADLEAYSPSNSVEAVAGQIESLPALAVELTGEVKSTNLASYSQIIEARVQAINTDLQTDQDFADADKMVKFLDAGEKEIEAVKKQALAQTASIDELFRTVDGLKELMRSKRLELNKLVKARKDELRFEIRSAAQAQLDEHEKAINSELAPKVRLPDVKADFAGAMRGKKTVATLRSACDDEVARVKVEMSMLGDKIQGNLKTLEALDAEHQSLLRDAQALVEKDPEDLDNLITARIIEHDAKVAAAAEKLAEENRKADAEKAAHGELREVPPANNIHELKAEPLPAQAGVHTEELDEHRIVRRSDVIQIIAREYNIETGEAELLLSQIFDTNQYTLKA